MIRVSIIIGICLLMGCVIEQESQLNATEKMFRYPYEMQSEKRIQFIETIKKLKAGYTYEQVTELLGIPFEEKIISAKKTDDPVRVKTITYYLKKNQKDYTNIKTDEYVSLVFDNNQKLIRTHTNIVGLSLPAGIEIFP